MVELIEKNCSDKEILEIIYREYGIKLAQFIIKNKRSKENIGKVKTLLAAEVETTTESIESVLALDNNSPKSSKEISALLNQRGIRLTKKEVNKIIYRELRNKVIYDNKEYLYSLRNTSEKREDNDESAFDLTNYIEDYDSALVIGAFRKLFKDFFIDVKTGNDKIDYLIKSIVKDNAITECEEIFLKQKASEMGADINLIDHAKKALYSNNPYLDNLIHIIFDDGVITNEELRFLKEKSTEHEFTKSFVNRRFWTTGITVYLNHLRSVTEFNKLIVLVFLGLRLDMPQVNKEMWLFSKLNIFEGSTLEEIISKAITSIREDLLKHIELNVTANGAGFIENSLKEIDIEREGSSVVETETEKKALAINDLIRLLDEEKIRVGTPDANLLVENVKFRIENDLWD